MQASLACSIALFGIGPIPRFFFKRLHEACAEICVPINQLSRRSVAAGCVLFVLYFGFTINLKNTAARASLPRLRSRSWSMQGSCPAMATPVNLERLNRAATRPPRTSNEPSTGRNPKRRLAGDPGFDDRKPLVERNEVGAKARRDRAKLGLQAKKGCRRARCH